MNSRFSTRLVTTTTRLVAIAAAAALAQGCATKTPTPTPPPTPTPTPTATTEESIVVRDLSGGIEADFAFTDVIGQILKSASVPDTQANKVALVQSMLDSFALNSMTNPASNLPMTVDTRSQEQNLGAAALLAGGVTPIGLFNRLDLAPADWSDCGEHRIVFATKPNASNARFLLIFEAKLPNPEPAKGMQGCEAVAKRWQEIGAAPTPAAREPLLKELYFTGLPGFGPVIHHLNYGTHLGQVRANMFVGATKWQLREFRVLPVGVQKLAFVPGPVANNPLAEFYADTGGSPALQAERTRYQAAFKTTYADALRDFDAKASATMSPAEFREGLLNCMGAPFVAADNEFQSDSQGNDDVPASSAGATFKASLPATWTSPDGSRTVTRDQLLNRAGAVTCGGCHQFSAGKALGASGSAVNWPMPKPAPGGNFFFVHISEVKQGNKHVISDTLQNAFIPHRQKVLASILAGENPGKHCAVTPPTASPLTGAAANPQAEAQKRQDAAAAAQRVLTAPPLTAAPGTTATAVLQMRALSDEAHARDLQKRGATVTFRRSH